MQDILARGDKSKQQQEAKKKCIYVLGWLQVQSTWSRGTKALNHGIRIELQRVGLRPQQI